MPVGGFTDMVLTRPGFASSSASVIHRLLTAAFARNHLGDFCGDGVLIETGLRDIEIETALAVANRTAGDGVRQHRREYMQRRVHAHAGVSPVPINLGGDAVADLWHGSAGRQHVRDLGLGGIGINGGFDRNARAVRRCERTGVARLPA